MTDGSLEASMLQFWTRTVEKFMVLERDWGWNAVVGISCPPHPLLSNASINRGREVALFPDAKMIFVHFHLARAVLPSSFDAWQQRTTGRLKRTVLACVIEYQFAVLQAGFGYNKIQFIAQDVHEIWHAKTNLSFCFQSESGARGKGGGEIGWGCSLFNHCFILMLKLCIAGRSCCLVILCFVYGNSETVVWQDGKDCCSSVRIHRLFQLDLMLAPDCPHVG